MPISATNLVASGNGTNLATYTTASITPAANALILAAIETDIGAGAPSIPTLTGNSLTWVQVIDCYFDQAGTTHRLTVFRAMGESPTTGAVTIDYAGVTQAGCTWVINQFTGVDTSGTNGSGAIVQSAKTAEPAAAATTSITATLASGITSGNAGWAAACFEVVETPTVTWTSLGLGSHASPSVSVSTQWTTTAGSTSATATWVTAALAGAIVIEIKDGGAASGFMTPLRGVWG